MARFIVFSCQYSHAALIRSGLGAALFTGTLLAAGSAMAASCMVQAPMGSDVSSPSAQAPVTTSSQPNRGEAAVGGAVGALPLATSRDFTYIGGFSLPGGVFGDSEMNYTEAVIEQAGNSLFIVGHVRDDAIAEFIIPELVNSRDISQLNSAGNPVQNFSKVLDRASGGNSQSMDVITGMEVVDGQLVVNAIEYYDAPADNSATTLVVSNAGNIAGSTVKGYSQLPGGAKSAGWLTELSGEWQRELGTTHLVGHSAGAPIIGRHSVGPSAYALNGADIVSAPANGRIPAKRLLEFSLDNPLNADLYNESLTNDIWTFTTGAKFGFIVPGTRTYATFGSATGFTSGLGYKITQDDGTLCAGPCSRVATDASNYFWLWDMNDLLEVKAGRRASHEVKPYSYGKFDMPFQTSDGFNAIGGGTYDASKGVVYFSVKDANNTAGPYSNPPVIAAYKVRSF